MKQKYKILVLALVLLAVGASLFFSRRTFSPQTNAPHPTGKTFVVTFTDQGFSPKDITISQYDSIQFVTTGDQAFWPASDPHPTHDIYPEFDPKQPVESSSSWTFNFGRVGVWKYHDHLFPTYRGSVTVLGSGRPSSDSSANCDPTNPDKSQCFDQLLGDAVKNENLDAAFQVFQNLYNTEPSFAANCHNFSHKLGQMAYDKYAKHQDFTLSAQTYYCGYGFYHGFMEALLHDTGDLSQAEAFCSYVGKHFNSGSGSQAESACYHGIGHGAVDGQPQDYKTAESFIAPALALCGQITADNDHKKLCSSGVYNALAIVWNTTKSNLSMPGNQPYGICQEQQDPDFARGCYHQMNTVAYNVAGSDFSKATKYVLAITEPDYALVAMDGLATHAAATHPTADYFANAVKVCRQVGQALHDTCIISYVSGIVEGGPPGSEYDSAQAFCNSNLLTLGERDSCFQRAASSLSIWYPQDKASQVCGTLPEQYRKYCTSS